ncbi:5-oxoprolinase subunit PxpA [Emticicia sp. CRIBPO]|uniref:LamB/YcsF family protein n=1 Tax=Emticicia sp. CRIBPO TaxID=2683258 RepID=UPI0014125D33|nr:5-oxoprolinase subunit PxpA [Emticicia sp. CRIBPO]NBA88548.1 5-oxoprolinase subunit PxpA [Emticicia sp. CRIBPO]
MKALKIDLNCDMGESFGAWEMGNDLAVMDYVTSVNIACGFHAGDPGIMRKTAAAALQKGVKIGAHPGFQDLQGFGRRNMDVTAQEVYDLCLYQIGALQATVKALRGKLHHVKPHGALYNMAAKQPGLAEAIAAAVKSADSDLYLYGLSGSCLIAEAEKAGLKTFSEVFADRTYRNDGSLTPRNEPNALLENLAEIEKHVLRMADEKKVVCADGSEIKIKADTVCIHGDGKNALPIAMKLFEILI